ncbi:CBS domain-containing protein [Enterococcus timonensis]|uniref:CBS domain-containing protein n=1 Tax=Enterococcus timonensis TaxID=1852364 RepID=UPI0008DAB0B2|nr:CBS domain-containing protein [Enterococcus timonensis]
MSISDFMSSDLITVTKETKIFDCLDLMKENNLHRLPVVDGQKLAGLITEGVINEALPSTATSLSVYEVNYLLNKTTAEEIMIKKLVTISPEAQLEDGIYAMRQNSVGVLPVVKEDQLVGMITNNDIFDAFLNISSYFETGMMVTIEISQDTPGVLAQITAVLAQAGFSILSLLVLRKEKTLVELRMPTTQENKVSRLLKESGFENITTQLINPPKK